MILRLGPLIFWRFNIHHMIKIKDSLTAMVDWTWFMAFAMVLVLLYPLLRDVRTDEDDD